MATGDVLSICNRALLAIGARAQVSDISPSDGSTEADACAVLFTPTFEALARAAYWNCLRDQVPLTLLAAAPATPENPQGTTLPYPPTPWLYSYLSPPESLAARFIVPSLPATGNTPISPALIPAATWLPTQQQIPFKVAYGRDSNNNPVSVILTNQTQAQLVYTINQPNPSLWDSQFQAAMVAALAAYLVPALSLNLPLMNMQKGIAEALIAQARARDADEGFTTQDHIPDWIRIRNQGYGGCATAYGNNGACNWADMPWPG